MAPITPPSSHKVNGIIYDEYDMPFINVIVQVFDKDLRTEKLLAQTKTDAYGAYAIIFKAEAPENPEYKVADVFIKVYDNTAQLLGQSKLYFNVGEETIINYKIGKTPFKGIPEYDALLAIIQPIVKSSHLLLGDLLQNDKFDDYNFLAGETGEEAERIQFLNTAYAFTGTTKIAPDIFYGLFRMGFPIVLNELLIIRADSIKKALLQAIEDNIISSKWAIKLDEIIALFNKHSVKKVLEGDDVRSKAFQKLFGNEFTKNQQEVFTSTYFANEETPEAFWDKLKLQPGFTDTDIKKTKQLISLHLLTSNQPELAQHLFIKQSSDQELREMSGYAKFSKEDWQQHITDAGVADFPEWVQGENKKEKKVHYAESLEQLHKELYPTQFFAARMKQDSSPAFSAKGQLNAFFYENPGFDLNSKNIHKQLDNSSFKGIIDKDDIKKELKTINRLYKLTDDYKHVKELYDKRLFSSTDIVSKYGKEQFVRQFAGAMGSSETAAKLYKKAVSVNNKLTALITAHKMKHDISIYAINGDSQENEENVEFWKGYHEMFKDGELCECDHCQSVYSPSAYFVDMLHFINSNKEEAYNKLLRRRPDLDDILLTCKNTNTPLPYIDLVNELLEKEVLALQLPDNAGRYAIRNQSFQTEGLAAELLAMPDHINSAAYNPLNSVGGNSIFSEKLPLDLPLEEIRAYTEKLGWKRYELINAFYGNNVPGRLKDEKLAAELFGISPAELKIITGETAIAVSLPLNADGNCVIKQLMEKTKFTYDELLQLLETHFLNPLDGAGRKVTITQIGQEPLLTCNLDKLLLTGAVDAWLNKAVRFVRLWKKTGWDIFDLDRVLTSLKPVDVAIGDWDFSNELIILLAHIENVRHALNITVKQSSALFNTIDTALYLDHTKEGQPAVPSLYEDIFKNIAVSDAASLSAALGITAEELATLENTTDYSLPKLSRMYRHVLLARGLRISLKELNKLVLLTGNDVVNGLWKPQQLCIFLDDWKIFKSVGIKVDEFKDYFIASSAAENSIPVNYSLLKQTGDCLNKLKDIVNDATLTEDDRKAQCSAVVTAFLNALDANIPVKSALGAATLTNPADLAIKTVFENYRIENKEIINSLAEGEMIIKMEALQKSLLEYLEVVLKKAPSIFTKLKFSLEEKVWMKDNKAALGIELLWAESIDFESEDFFIAFKKLYWLSVLAKNGKNNWIDILDVAIKNAAIAKAELFEKCITLCEVTKPALEFLCGPEADTVDKGRLNFIFPDDYINAENIITVLKCCKTIEKLGGNTEQLQAVLNIGVTPAAAQAVQNLLRSKYKIKEWLDIIKPISDALRTIKRDALSAWLIANTNSGIWHDPNDIYEYLLIDTEMEACMVTSRIKQAISSVQLYIDRCLINLENGIHLNDEFAEQWHKWRKQYRVWEANRKVFLYPENWIEPDLRDDKSPFFKELESQLKQNEVTEETAKEALIGYLQKLDTVANLEVVGLFKDEETKIVHVIGRTQNIPHQYFYRKQENNVWTAWEKVEVDIEGDHILPVVWNGRLILFWGVFTEKQEKQGDFITPRVGEKIPPPVTYLELKLAWSEFKNGKWSAKKISKEFYEIPFDFANYLPQNEGVMRKKMRDSLPGTTHPIKPGSVDSDPINITQPKHYMLSSDIYSGQLYIKIGQCNDLSSNKIFWIGHFLFYSCNSMPVVPENNSINGTFLGTFHEVSGNFLLPKTATEFKLSSSGVYGNMGTGNGTTLLKLTTLDATVSSIRHSIVSGRNNYFFYLNSKNNYFVTSYSQLNDFFVPDINNLGSQIISRRKVEPGISESDVPSELLRNGDGAITHIKAGEIKNTELIREKILGIYSFLTKPTYSFHTFYHPYACFLIRELNMKGIPALYDTAVQDKLTEEFYEQYMPEANVTLPYPIEELDFSYLGSYSNYNWELFFHIPLLIATRLTQNQKFEEARKWFHYIFNPTRSSSGINSAKRFWITKPYIKEIEEAVLPLEELLGNKDHASELELQLTNWENTPYNPHAIARLRISAYMRNTVLRYIDNLIQWGDQLFRKDTIESINEATLLYILASNILGKKQETVPARAKPVEKSFSVIKDQLDRFSNVKAELESFISPSSGDENILMPYFCLPKNEYLLKYWDTIADRLFKIRHSMNIEGVVRQLPLFEPPIDPSLLVRATAAGLSLNEILNDINAGLPNYRFQIILQQANELCNDVKSLGNSLLSALEKKDGEELALLRSAHEIRMLEMIKDVKEKQRNEAKENLEVLLRSKESAEYRRSYYSSRDFKNSSEEEYYTQSLRALISQEVQQGSDLMAGLLFKVPGVTAGAWSWGITTGGQYLGASATAFGRLAGGFASYFNYKAALANTLGSFERRMDDWKFQEKSAELELKQIDKQIIAAEIRLAITEKEIENHDLQMEQSKAVDDYMQSKFTNAELYDWMVGQISTVYFQSYQLAYATAKKAEKCMQHELGLEATNYIQFGYWDSLKKGLLSGEKLQYDLRRLENAYLEENKREYEIVKHVSLVMLDPLALIKLRSTGSCEFEIPEVLYDMDFPGHYFRRLKSVSVSLPCIAGPYTSVSATLSLMSNRYRKNANPNNDANTGYAEDQGNDNRFNSNVGAIQSIATSNAQNDSGVFELNFRDERYLPFEGTGAISKWKLELPSEIRQFDYNTVTDVIIHVKYTAREGGSGLKTAANGALRDQLEAIKQGLKQAGLPEATGLHIALNLKHDLPNEWHLLKKNGTIDLILDKSRLPYMVQSVDTAEIDSVMFIAKIKDNPATFTLNLNGADTNLAWMDELKLFKGINSDIDLDTLFTLSVSEAAKLNLEDLILIVKYKF